MRGKSLRFRKEAGWLVGWRTKEAPDAENLFSLEVTFMTLFWFPSMLGNLFSLFQCNINTNFKSYFDMSHMLWYAVVISSWFCCSSVFYLVVYDPHTSMCYFYWIPEKQLRKTTHNQRDYGDSKAVFMASGNFIEVCTSEYLENHWSKENHIV